MDIFTQLSDPHPFGSPNSFSSNDYNKLQEDTSSLSDAGTTTPPPHSDEEVACHTLATNRPKKRAGRKVFQETRHPVYRGVRRRNGEKWVCEMREPNNKKKRIWLGTYPTPEMAARAHDVAALALRGRSAVLNFADSAWRLPTPVSLDAKEIRRVANEGAQMFQPRPDDGLNEIDFGGSSNVEGRNEASNNVFRKEVNDNDRDNRNSKSNVSYVDEEAMLDMPSLLADMAQGLLLSPPSYLEDGSSNWDQMESDSGFSLWSY